MLDNLLISTNLAAAGVASGAGFVAGLAWGWLRQALSDLSTTD
jgi:hypothetical protein